MNNYSRKLEYWSLRFPNPCPGPESDPSRGWFKEWDKDCWSVGRISPHRLRRDQDDD